MRWSHTDEFRRVGDLVPAMLWLSAPDRSVVWLNRAWEAFAGRPVGELAGFGWRDLLHPDDVEHFDLEVEIHEASREPYQVEFRMRRFDGEWRHLAETRLPRREDGEFLGYVGAAMDVTDLRRAEEALRFSETHLDTVAAGAPVVLFAVDRDGVFTFSTGRGLEALGHEPGEAVGVSAFKVYAEQPEIVAAFKRALAGEEVETEVELDGTVFDAVVAPVFDDEGRPDGAVGVATLVTARVAAERQLRAERERYGALLETAPDAILIAGPDGRVMHANTQASRLFEATADQLIGASLSSLVPQLPWREAVADGTVEVEGPGGQLHARRRGHGDVPVDVRLSASSEDGQLVTVILRDVSQRVRFEEQLRHLADHDPLTGLYNRRRFEDELGREVAMAERHGGGALLLLDLDNVKDVNDTLGHQAGDALIRRTAHALHDRVRSSDVLARIGGDEFAVLMPRATVRDAERLADDLVKAVREQVVVLAERVVHATTSVGIAPMGDGHASAADVLAAADLAMYAAKAAGGDRISFYEAGHGREAEARLTWAGRIRRALERGEWVLHLQPLLDLRTNELTRYEVLLRAPSSNGLALPSTFLSTAEHLGLMPAIDIWVVRRAIDIMANWPGALRLQVNLSGQAVDDPETTMAISEALAQSDVEAHRLTFEITETTAISNMQQARAFTEEVERMGCGVALDDFGTGFASLAYLKHLPVDMVKIDGDFVRSVTSSQTDRIVVRSIVELARSLGICTVAEYVEDARTLSTVREFGVDYAQGYHVGAPIPVEAL